jgi:hypothetical protein
LGVRRVGFLFQRIQKSTFCFTFYRAAVEWVFGFIQFPYEKPKMAGLRDGILPTNFNACMGGGKVLRI